jgi:hypothetical protein
MGVRDNIEFLKQQRDAYKVRLEILGRDLINAKESVKIQEQRLSQAKRSMNANLRDRKKVKDMLKTVEGKIKRFPSETRRYAKTHAIEIVEGEFR